MYENSTSVICKIGVRSGGGGGGGGEASDIYIQRQGVEIKAEPPKKTTNFHLLKSFKNSYEIIYITISIIKI